MKKFLLALFLSLLLLGDAYAASRFWVGGTGTWDGADTTHWAATSGGAGGQSVPGSADTVTFDASSGGGTVTVNTTVTVQQITMGAFTGTLDFATNNNNVTLSSTVGFSGTGTGTRTLNLGSGTFTLSATSGNTWDFTTVTNLTLNAGTATIAYTGTGTAHRGFIGGASQTYSTVSFQGSGGYVISGTSMTIGTMLCSNCSVLYFPSGTTTTITNPFAFVGTASAPILVSTVSSTTAATIATAAGSATCVWCGFRRMAFGGGATFTATNSQDYALNTGITITPPTVGSSSRSVSPGIGQ